MPLILASASPIRKQMLGDAGVSLEIVPASIDEDSVKRLVDDPVTLATRLAEAKAAEVSARRPADWVIGSDSVVAVDGRIYSKPSDRNQAEDHLRRFSGRTMNLVSAVALARNGTVDWSLADQATLFVRQLSASFIDDYLDQEWPAVSGCVGVFRMEGPGVQLFERVEGSHFTILGIPLIPLLGALRDRGELAS